MIIFTLMMNYFTTMKVVMTYRSLWSVLYPVRPPIRTLIIYGNYIAFCVICNEITLTITKQNKRINGWYLHYPSCCGIITQVICQTLRRLRHSGNICPENRICLRLILVTLAKDRKTTDNPPMLRLASFFNISSLVVIDNFR